MVIYQRKNSPEVIKLVMHFNYIKCTLNCKYFFLKSVDIVFYFPAMEAFFI